MLLGGYGLETLRKTDSVKDGWHNPRRLDTLLVVVVRVGRDSRGCRLARLGAAATGTAAAIVEGDVLAIVLFLLAANLLPLMKTCKLCAAHS